ncbi:unnamed protein product [Ilex paraguariensis]|uniref:Uncharacterized protein n=1 Tax=Ilex paraguariensis TaxID=185542 RepID=A0ABC8TDZ9_9AQUA
MKGETLSAILGEESRKSRPPVPKLSPEAVLLDATRERSRIKQYAKEEVFDDDFVRKLKCPSFPIKK